MSLACPTDVSVKRKLIHNTTELIHLHALRNERKESRRGAGGKWKFPGLLGS